ncbi:lasso RiPP family leader peptide-containing protein [Hydrogenophaga sp. RWCD_12]|uniref:lasso RiPP family leader peptide-containing protein n=1 Tax=Hydrogenophaga sp. RWCD_12 TaxID=3391190 RepID=UPI00398495D0
MNHFVAETSAKKAYVAPELVMHGDLRTLTQGGSQGVVTENKSGGTGTNCGTAVKKRC